MITHAAQDSFERIFFQAARTRLTVDAGHACEIERVAGQGDMDSSVDMIVLTIASIDFRIVLLLQFADDDATRGYYAAHSAERSLRESAMEIGNLCCGAINQQLVEHFPDLGMSTPYALSSDCMGYLDELDPQHVAVYDVTIEHAARLRATLCVCAQRSLDFVAQVADVQESAGELELF
ncbi:hypothetical protein C0Z18_10680 [Trinickia dabaoshanensis]|uniref:Uncharacterized protein n=1 Tax=Trinickia dabaoshanensis TaxID=564714 RepID=A0A2N7VTB4_9BURK|nr:hypothetical protein [Trinickia dabaoshanensis]PMS20396.1 hypothetical protein C0Z18_10680 [Trinickia dabaoshanensis]